MGKREGETWDEQKEGEREREIVGQFSAGRKFNLHDIGTHFRGDSSEHLWKTGVLSRCILRAYMGGGGVERKKEMNIYEIG